MSHFHPNTRRITFTLLHNRLHNRLLILIWDEVKTTHKTHLTHTAQIFSLPIYPLTRRIFDDRRARKTAFTC